MRVVPAPEGVGTCEPRARAALAASALRPPPRCSGQCHQHQALGVLIPQGQEPRCPRGQGVPQPSLSSESQVASLLSKRGCSGQEPCVVTGGRPPELIAHHMSPLVTILQLLSS